MKPNPVAVSNNNRDRSALFAMKAVVTALIIIFSGTTPGCTYLPSSGPSASRIEKEAQSAKYPESYQLIPITSEVVNTLARNSNKNERNSLSSLKAETVSHSSDSRLSFRVSSLGVSKLPAVAPQTINVGDYVQVTIYETGGALFGSPAPQGAAGTFNNQLPPQSVDESGSISVPFAGRILVKGRSPYAVEGEIAEKLKGKAINPQVIVAVTDRKGGNLVTVTGDVKSPMGYPLGFAGARVLDAVTASGGSIGKAQETLVSVIRGSVVRSDSLADITSYPSKNVALQPGDTVVAKNVPRTYLVFGAVGSTSRHPFEADQVSLADAMAQSGGALDNRANPAAIFVFRVEPKTVVKKLGYEPKAVVGSGASVIYNLNLVEPKGFFLARNFEVQDKDIIYIGNASSVGLAKFFNVINSITTGIRTEAQTTGGF